MNTKIVLFFAFALSVVASCKSKSAKLEEDIRKEFGSVSGKFALAFEDLSTGEQVLVNEHEIFHAASTMKTPVMIEVFKQAAAGKFSLSDSVVIKNEFKSIVDGSLYTLTSTDDSETTLYDKGGRKMTINDLMYEMIIVSSNLATNIIIELVDAKKVMETMSEIGAKETQVLRGVEDNKAFKQGMNNTTSASDLMLIFSKLAKGEVVSKEASKSMIEILLDQKFNDIIPAQLPKNVKVAHKTGSIKGVHHDSGIVMLPDGRQYVLVLLSKDIQDEQAGIKVQAAVSKLIYDYVTLK